MSHTLEQMRAYERARWAQQVEHLRAWLDALEPVAPQRDALRRALLGEAVPDAALAQQRFDLQRDLGRLESALAGQTPSAVQDYRSPEALACGEAVHTADNALVFLGRARAATTRTDAVAALERAQRWIQRLRWEQVGTGHALDIPTDLGTRAVAQTGDLAPLVEEAQATLRQLRTTLSHPA